MGSSIRLVSLAWVPPFPDPLGQPKLRLWLRYTPPGATEALYFYAEVLHTYQGRFDIPGPDEAAAINATEVRLHDPWWIEAHLRWHAHQRAHENAPRDAQGMEAPNTERTSRYEEI